MANYIDGFVFRIARKYLDEYKQVAEKVASIWKEHGALDYFEFESDDLALEGPRSFTECVNASEDDAIIFGWVVFASRAARDQANERVASDSRMEDLVGPLTNPSKLIFDASRMNYGGFKALI